MSEIETEHLVRLKLQDGTYLDFHRDADNTVRVCRSDGHCLYLPRASGLLTTELFTLLEPLGEAIFHKEIEND
jgi:hypothetical protein